MNDAKRLAMERVIQAQEHSARIIRRLLTQFHHRCSREGHIAITQEPSTVEALTTRVPKHYGLQADGKGGWLEMRTCNRCGTSMYFTAAMLAERGLEIVVGDDGEPRIEVKR